MPLYRDHVVTAREQQALLRVYRTLRLHSERRVASSMSNNATNFPSFLDTSSSSNSLGGAQRLAPAPMAQQQQQANGNGNGMNGVPILAGQQMDVNLLYQKVVELSEVLKENREKTQGIVNGAENLAVSAQKDSFGSLGPVLKSPFSSMDT